ncbi:hypothetical protein Taro_019034 [Colocasia esculenta]|uniref:Uncharacterized protein n=1 Tax=Colocasia esculenta TaxID=4460 RepID=A0A843UK42_COLES|nr:hypothetical protein [Colocasia esculenta]
MVNENMSPDNLPFVLSIVIKGPTITFSEGELAPPEARRMPLCVTLTINKVKQQKLLEAPGSWGGCAGCVRGSQRPGAGWASKMEALEMGAAWPRQEGGCWAMA